jgi:hypothetical protein
VILDPGGNILVASSTRSTNFPTQNGFQTGLRGSQDAVVLKINSNSTAVTWSTTLGGDGDDAGFVLSVNPLSPANIYVVVVPEAVLIFQALVEVFAGIYNGGIGDGYVANCRITEEVLG